MLGNTELKYAGSFAHAGSVGESTANTPGTVADTAIIDNRSAPWICIAAAESTLHYQKSILH